MEKIAAKDVNDMTDHQLVEYVGEATQELFNLRFRHATGELENTASVKTAKKALARGLTVASSRNLDIKKELQRA